MDCFHFCICINRDPKHLEIAYAAIPLALVGDNSLVSDLQVLTSIELYLKADVYSQHTYFLSAHAKHMEKVSQSLNNLLPIPVSNRVLDFGCSGNQLVKKEAILNCCDNTWSSFLCILGLASVTEIFFVIIPTVVNRDLNYFLIVKWNHAHL